jgi:hypothetical protein
MVDDAFARVAPHRHQPQLAAAALSRGFSIATRVLRVDLRNCDGILKLTAVLADSIGIYAGNFSRKTNILVAN